MPASDLPSIGDPVVLRDADGLVYSSRVEDLDGDMIAVARPADLRAALEYPEGMELQLVWTLSTGVHVLPVELAGASVDQHIRLWHLAITGAGWSEQRRDYVRVPAVGRITLEPEVPEEELGLGAAAEPEWRLDGQLVDLSEVATQCAVPAATDDPRIAADTRVRCEFGVNGQSFDVRGTIVIVRAGSGARDARVVVRFDPARATADALRKQVFAIQLAIRRGR